MGTFLNILLVTILVFYAFSLIIKLIFRRKIKKLQQHMEQFSEGGTESKPEKEQMPHVNPTIGEYTDFEEIE